MDRSTLLSVLVVSTWRLCESIGPYNVKSYTLVSPSDPATSLYFGYSVMLRDGPDPQISVGAPRASSPHPAHQRIEESGALYVCSLSNLDVPVLCNQLILDLEGNTRNPLTRGMAYHHGKDNMWLGAAMTGSQSTNGTLVVCAPRWVNKYYEHQQHYFANGLCYTLPNTNGGVDDAAMLLPLVDQYKQGFLIQNDLATSSYGPTSYLYAYGQAGMSVHLTEDNRQLLIGAPGVFVWTGSVIRYSVMKQRRGPDYYSKQNVPNTYYTSEIEEASYFGYSVSSGHFTNGTSLQYVGGAPRGAENLGQVLIFEYGIRSEGRLRIQAKLSSEQLGSYFGASVCVLDLNADGVDDLAVGAPMHAGIKLSQTHLAYDEGRVYIYLSVPSEEKKVHLELMHVLEGDAESSARFGSALANLGDLDGDGFPELGIGAPYSNDGAGAMFVYSGSEAGVNPKYLQRISFPHLKGFGISVSKGVDLDHNGCNDVAIGAYASNRAVVLRCHPTMRVRAYISVRPSTVAEKIGFIAQFCLKSNASVSDAHTELVVRVGMNKTLGRAYPVDELLSQYEVKLVGSSDSCKDIEIILKENDDFSHPVVMTMSYEMKKDPREEDKFCSKCSVVEKELVTRRVSLEIGCSDTVCIPDLVLTFKQKSIENVIGSGERIVVRLDVLNKGEPAFLPVVSVELPANVLLANLPTTCRQPVDKHKTNLVCDLPNPLSSNKTASVELELVAGTLWGGAAPLFLNARAYSSGQEYNDRDNKRALRLDWITQSHVNVTGSSFPEQDVLVDQLRLDSGRNIILAHAYNLNNFGPTPWSNVELTFLIETGLPDQLANYTLVDVYEPTARINEQPIECKLSSGHWYTLSLRPGEDVNPEGDSDPLLVRRKRGVENPDMFCAHDTCLLAHCALGQLRGDQAITVDFKILVKLDRLAAAFREIDDITITSFAVITPLGVSSDKTWQYEASAQSRLRAVHTQPPIAWIVGAVLGGILTLAILSYVLYKFGFFRRKEQDEMRLLKNKEQSEEGIQNSIISSSIMDINDHNLVNRSPTNNNEILT